MRRHLDRLAGALLLLALLLFGAGGLSRAVPDSWPGAVVPRFCETLAPWLLAAGALAALAAASLGARRQGGLLAGLCLLAGVGLLAGHLRLTLPEVGTAEEPGDLRVLFFNVLYSNTANAEAIADMVIAEDPDIVLFAEYSGVLPAFPKLRAHFPYAGLCGGRPCSPAVFSRLEPRETMTRALGAMENKGMFRGRFALADGREVTLIGVHLLKPWISGYAAIERETLIRQAAKAPEASVMLGDFNAPSWTSTLQEILDQTGFRALRRPRPSWPAGAGSLGIPLDHVLVRGGTRVVSARTVGTGLGSNHLGLLVTLRLPAAPAS
ncbi:MAG: hypothetical protein GYB51_20520 [Rhodobacteraceae bacterium]|nr:hypothetical protein [Paracoccaceae bacterium]